MIYDTKDWVFLEEDELNEQRTEWFYDKKHEKIISVAEPNKEQRELYSGVI
jgi:hypothetical protein